MGIYPLSSLLKGMAKASKTVMARLAYRNPDSPYPLRRNTPNYKRREKDTAKECCEAKRDENVALNKGDKHDRNP